MRRACSSSVTRSSGSPSAALCRIVATLVDLLAHWRDAIGVAVYFAVCREGEIEIVAVAESPYAPGVAEWRTLLERLASTERMQPVLERQEYALGTGCAAI